MNDRLWDRMGLGVLWQQGGRGRGGPLLTQATIGSQLEGRAKTQGGVLPLEELPNRIGDALACKGGEVTAI